MRKFFTLFFSLLTMNLGLIAQSPTELWRFSTVEGSTAANADHIKNGIAVSNGGKYLYLSTRGSASQVVIYDAATGLPTTESQKTLKDLTGFSSLYGGDVATDQNGAIYASNVIISAAGALNVARWDSHTATPTLFISTTAHGGSNAQRIGYALDVRVDEKGDGFLLMHKNATADLLYWEIKNNVPVSQDPTVIAISSATAITDSYARISIVDDNKFWLDGSVARASLCTITRSNADFSAPTAVAAVTMGWISELNVGVCGATEFTLNGKRYAVFAGNNHSIAAGYNQQHYAFMRELDGTGVSFAAGSSAIKLPEQGLGKVSDGSHFVKPVIYLDTKGENAYIYLMGGFNGIAAYKFTDADPTSVNEDAVSATKVYPSNGVIVVETASTGATIEVYTLQGAKVVVASASGSDELSLAKGVYIVKVGNDVFKEVL